MATSTLTSTSSCWTCRLRKKKCDASHPTCQTCRRLLIPCYAYGTKPGWMDGGDREQDMLAEIRSGVKSTTERLRRGRALKALRQRHPLTAGAGAATATVTVIADPTVSARQVAPAAHGSDPLPRPVTVTTTTATTPTVTDEPRPREGENENHLLDSYFERVFPRQFPFYHASLVEKDCGWLRVLALRCESLKYAVLALAVADPDTDTGPDPGPDPDPYSVDNRHAKDDDMRDHHSRQSRDKEQEQEELYALAVSGLRDHIDRVSRKSLHEGLRDGIEVFVCVIYLIMLENTRGRFNNWQKHMAASPGLFPFLTTYCASFPDPGVSVLHGEDELVDAAIGDATSLDSALSFVDHAAMEFFSAVLLWFDTLACVSTGRPPRYADVCAAAFGPRESKIRLRNIMGCENWVMIIIRDIAILGGGSTTCGRGRHIARDEGIIRKHDELRERLELGLVESWESYLSLLARRTKGREQDIGLIQASPIVTYIFACAAMVYLTVGFDGPDPHLPAIRDAVSKALTVFNALPDRQLLRSLVWPFCITGCMAQKDQESSFVHLASLAGISNHRPDTLWKALQVMETCWQIRSQENQEPPSADWVTAMSRLGYQVLLV
ncbi:hypothetical protein G647_04878 [Cladophialophora carrionii CBS 160.54]|uniref:Zn(2)-C6 fungal-type domain-containing protein n=1 Tax=Cladophialophora carrionii CBS 160.54 TaxID=1279043 RepID=V9DAT4_9EURO|nr:uncharacterized protein G647_04878 [Cladophialophora carrionii CBS 160.54]ETI23082.1 hypothetical protein G647_04878 [Cladophialophora carrionii CBS 160.54]